MIRLAKEKEKKKIKPLAPEPTYTPIDTSLNKAYIQPRGALKSNIVVSQEDLMPSQPQARTTLQVRGALAPLKPNRGLEILNPPGLPGMESQLRTATTAFTPQSINQNLRPFQGPPKPTTLGDTFERRIAAGREATEGKPIQSVINRLLEPITALGTLTEKPAQIAGQLYTPGAGISAIGAGTQAVEGLLARYAPKIGYGEKLIPSAAREAIKEVSVGIPLGAGQALAQDPGISGMELAKQTALGGGLGAGFGAIGGGVGSLINRMRLNNVPDEVVQELLALPAPRQRGRISTVTTPDIMPGFGGGRLPELPAPGPLGLPAPSIAAPTTGRIAQQVNPYRQQFETLMQRAQQLQQEGRFTPGREDIELESLWSKMAGREGVSIDELIQRAYPTRTSRVTPDLVQSARASQAAREVAGAPLPVRSTAERLTQPQGILGRAAAPVERVGRAPQAEVLPTQAQPVRPSPTQPIHRPADTVETETIGIDVEDVILPAAEEVAPRLRDKLNSYADNLIEQAKAELRSNRLSSNPLDVYAKFAAGYMLKGTAKLADITEQLVKDFGESIRPQARAIFSQAKQIYKDTRKQIEGEELGVTNLDATQLKDLSNINLNTADYTRNMSKVLGRGFEPIKKAILDPFEDAKGQYAQTQKELTGKLMREVVRDLGIRKGSKESALVQQYGEGQITLDELKKAAPNKYEDIVRADSWFRGQYNTLINEVNQAVAQIYPNNPDKLVPIRKDYYRHFQEMNAISGLKNLFDTASARISPSLAGISPFTTPKTKWASFKQKRGLGEFKNDAVGGFLDYIPAAAYAKHIDPHISVFRNLAKRLATETEESANINNFIKYLNNFANDLAGKTSPIDRWVEEIGGRKALQIVTSLNNRVKTNTILGNVGSIIAQTASLPQTLAYGGRDAVPGLARTFMSLFQPNPAMEKSRFMKERYLDKHFRQFDQRWWEQPKRFAEAALELGDLAGGSFAWNTAYAKGVREGVENPVRFADLETRRLLAGRGVGEAPLLMKSKVFNLIAPFQLEVNNAWRVMKDFIDVKQFGKLAMLLVWNNIFNHAAESIRGTGVTFDPIDAIWEAATEEDLNILQRGGRFGGEILSNIPLGQNLAAMYPEYGTNLYGVDLPSREALFGEKDPTRFGTGLTLTKGLQDPLFKIIAPFGGSQIKKTIQSADALIRGGAYTDNILTTGKRIEEPKLKFPVEPTAENIAKGLLFGQYATAEGKKYAKEELRPLSEKQTQQYQKSSNKEAFYEKVMEQRKSDAEKRKAKENK